MNFKVKKIRKKIKPRKKEEEFEQEPAKSTPSKLAKKFNAGKYSIHLSIIIPVVIIALLIGGIVKAVSSIDFTVFLEIAGEELQTDAFGHTNFMVLGTGGGEHEGADLTDTIIVASLDNENKLISMVSIPRDLYIKDNEVGSSKINEVYFNAKNYYGSSISGLEHMKEKIEEIMGIPIHYWVKVDFQGFKELVDALGGIDVYVEESIYDPYYPKDGTYLYEPFSIAAGQHHLDGETALKYARSRKTTSDFDRAKRQQQIIYAIKEKALQTEIVLSQEKITELLETLKKNIETNIKIKEILTLGSMADDYSEEQISHRLIHDDPNQCGGFLYTPSREFYNGMFVLIPAGGFEFLHRYADMNFNLPLIAEESAKVHILNGTRTAGIAGEAKQILKRYCIEVIRFGNAKDQNLNQTTYYYEQKYDENGEKIPSRPHLLDFLQKMIPGQENTEIPQEYKEYMTSADIIIEIGQDYANSPEYIDDPFYYLPPAISSTPSSETIESNSSEQ